MISSTVVVLSVQKLSTHNIAHLNTPFMIPGLGTEMVNQVFCHHLSKHLPSSTQGPGRCDTVQGIPEYTEAKVNHSTF